MKKLLFILVVAFLINGCNDGDIDVVAFDFTGNSAKSCNLQSFFVYSVKGNRTFILQIDEANFKNQVTPAGEPIKVPISGTTRITYREYNGNVSEAAICSSPPDASLIRTKEWTATGGIVEISTTAVLEDNATTNASVIGSYNHTIIFRNIAFSTGDSEQKNDEIQFGIFNKTNPYKLAIDQNITPKACGTNRSFLYKFTGNQTLSLDVEAAIFDTSILLTPKTRILSGTNKMTYRVLSNGNVAITEGYFCSNPTPFQNIEQWISQTATGTIQVVTENNAPNGFKHTIKLLNVTMEKGTLKFRLGNEYLYGVFSHP